jgi:hypothetical protein
MLDSTISASVALICAALGAAMSFAEALKEWVESGYSEFEGEALASALPSAESDATAFLAAVKELRERWTCRASVQCRVLLSAHCVVVVV